VTDTGFAGLRRCKCEAFELGGRTLLKGRANWDRRWRPSVRRRAVPQGAVQPLASRRDAVRRSASSELRMLLNVHAEVRRLAPHLQYAAEVRPEHSVFDIRQQESRHIR